MTGLAGKPGKRVLLGIDYSRSANDTLPRLLHRAGCRTTLVCPRNILAARTRLAERVILCAPGKQAFLDAFCAELASGGYDWAVVAHDYQAQLLAQCERAALEPWFPVPPGDPGTHFVFAKNAFLQTCRAAGIPVPRFEICFSTAEARAAAAAIGYPVVVKLARGYAGETTFLASDPDALEGIVNAIDRSEGFAVQRMIAGQIGSTDVLFAHGRPLCRLSSYSGDCAPTPFSPKTARQIIESPALDRIVDRIGALSSYHGLAGIDWVRDAVTGEFLVLEISPNPDGGYALTGDAERLFANGVRALLAGDPTYRPKSVPARAGWIPIAPEWSFYFATCANRRSPAAWLRFAQMLTHISWRDPGIAFAQLRAAFRFLAVASWPPRRPVRGT